MLNNNRLIWVGSGKVQASEKMAASYEIGVTDDLQWLEISPLFIPAAHRHFFHSFYGQVGREWRRLTHSHSIHRRPGKWKTINWATQCPEKKEGKNWSMPLICGPFGRPTPNTPDNKVTTVRVGLVCQPTKSIITEIWIFQNSNEIQLNYTSMQLSTLLELRTSPHLVATFRDVMKASFVKLRVHSTR